MGAGRPPRRSSMVRPDRVRPGSRRPEIRSDKAPRGIFGAIGSAAIAAAKDKNRGGFDRRAMLGDRIERDFDSYRRPPERQKRPDEIFGSREIRPDRRRRPPEVPVRKETPGREINSRGLRDQKFAEFLNIMNKRREIRRGRPTGRKRFGRGVRRKARRFTAYR